MAWSITLDFGDTTGPRDITDYVNLDSFRRQRQYHTDLRAVSWRLSFGMVRNPTISTLLLGNEGDVDISVTKDGDPYFVGQLDTDYVVAIRTRLQEVPIKAVDNGARLRRVMKGDGAGGDVKLVNFKVCDPGDTEHSIVHELLDLAGFSGAEMDLGAGDTIASVIDYWVALLGDNKTYWDHLDQLLFEFGYLMHFGADGKFRIDDAYPSDTSVSETFDSGNMIGELEISRKADRYEGAEVKYLQHYTNTNVVLFRDTTNGTDSQECNIAVAAGDYYPLGAEDGDVYCEYARQELVGAPAITTPTAGIGYGVARKRTNIQQGDLIVANNVELRTVMDTGITVDTFTDRYVRAKLKLENTTASAAYIKKLNIIGDAVVATNPAIVESNNHANTDLIAAYDAAFLTTKAQATRLAEGLEDYYRTSCLQYRWLSRTAADMGDIVLIEDDVLGTSNIVRVTGAVDNEKYGTVAYAGEGLAAFVAGVVTQHSVFLAAQKKLVAHELTVAASGYSGFADLWCDGDTDQSEIQTAVDYLVDTFGGGTVRLSEGSFYLDGKVTLSAGVSIVGRGASTVISMESSDPAFYVSGLADATVDGWSIEGVAFTRGAGDPLTDEFIWAEYAKAILVTRCHFLDVKFRTIYMSNVSGELSNCYFTGEQTAMVGNGVVAAFVVSKGLRVIGNLFQNVSQGVSAILLDLVACTDGVFESNRFIDCIGGTGTGSSFVAIRLSGTTTGNSVNGNKILNCYSLGSAASTYSVIDLIDTPLANMIANNNCSDNGNLIDRGNCESATPPYLTGETDDNNSNCTFDRSGDTAHNGDYSFKFTKTVAAGTGARTRFHNHTDATAGDMAGLVAGCAYTLSAWVYIPTASGILGSEITFELDDEDSAATTQAAANTYDEWQYVTVTRTLGTAATGVEVAIAAASAAANNEYFYVDDIRVRPDGVHNEHGQNFSDAGTGTRVSGNSWQNPFQS